MPMICGCAACVAERSDNEESAATTHLAQDWQPSVATSSDTTAAATYVSPSAPSYAVPALSSGYKWGGPGITVTFSFLTSIPGYYSLNADERDHFVTMNATQRQAALDAFALYSEVANITFVQVASGQGSINLGTADLGSGVGGWAYYPRTYSGANDATHAGDVWITNRYSDYNAPTPGSWAYLTYIHEIGHAIGMKHPGNYNAGGGGTPGPYLPTAEDNHQYTTMSYYSGPGYGGTEPITPQLYDIATVQALYGVNSSTRAGNDTYTFATSLQIRTIWDGAGIDVFDASNQTSGVSIDLRPGKFSSISGTNNIAIALGTIIENAAGSAFADTLRSNDGGGTLDGRGGNDTLLGGDGNDRLVGGSGIDSLTGGLGADIYAFALGDSPSSGQHDLITDFTAGTDFIDLSAIDADTSSAGILDKFRFIATSTFDGIAGALNYVWDSARSVTVVQGDVNGDGGSDFSIDLAGNLTLTAASFTAASVRPVEPLTLVGTDAPDSFTGDLLDDSLYGVGGADTLSGLDGDDLLDGGTGADAMIGGRGDDTYVVDDTGDVVTETSGTPFAVPSGWTINGTADFNNDGEMDITVASGSTYQMWLLQNGAVLSTTVLPTWTNWAMLGLLDYDADGDKDLLYSYTPDGHQFVVHLDGPQIAGVYSYPDIQLAPDPVQALTSNQGTDTVQASISYTLGNGVENLTLTGSGHFSGTGNSAANVIAGNAGNNILSGKGGADTLTGNGGADTFSFGTGDTGSAVGQRDLIADFTVGTDLIDLTGIDADIGLNGIDAFRFLGSSAFDGTAAALRYGYDSGRGVTTIEGDTNGDGIADFGIDLSGDKALTQGSFSNGSLLLPQPLHLTGTTDAETLIGGEMNDTLSGFDGADTLSGLDGDDLLDGGTGADTMTGGRGDDTYVVDDAGDAVTEANGEGNLDLVKSSITYTLGSNLERLTLTGTTAIKGTGNELNNTLIGNVAANTLSGLDGNDRLLGGGGKDVLIGGGGMDILTGGGGADTFRFLAAADSGITAATRDRIADFAAGDRIDLSAIDADPGTSADNTFTLIGAAGFTRHAGELRVYASGANTIVAGDIDGNGKGDFQILLIGSHTLGASDFVL
jgi:serralysin